MMHIKKVVLNDEGMLHYLHASEMKPFSSGKAAILRFISSTDRNPLNA